MRFFIILVSLFAVLGMEEVVLAESEIPDLKGTWTMECFGIGHEKTAQGNPPKLHADKVDFHDFEVTLVINRQEGFRFSGYIESSKKKEAVSGVVGFDNKSIYWAFEAGIEQSTLVSPDKMQSIYLQASPHHSIAARVIITRKR